MTIAKEKTKTENPARVKIEEKVRTEEKKVERKKKKRVWFLLAIILLILLVFLMFFYFVMASPSKPRSGTEIENPIGDMNLEYAISQFNESYISHVVFAIGGWKLHAPPLSEDTPKVKVIVDGEIYISEIIDMEIKTEKKETENEDIVIKTTKREIVLAILSPDVKNYIKQSVSEGKTTLELKASYTKLFSKGYLSLYKDITGKSFTGSVVRIFAQG